ncbi:MAG: hypothetical protein ABR604_05555 [Jatrophihabitantaceae bacterium]
MPCRTPDDDDGPLTDAADDGSDLYLVCFDAAVIVSSPLEVTEDPPARLADMSKPLALSRMFAGRPVYPIGRPNAACLPAYSAGSASPG